MLPQSFHFWQSHDLGDSVGGMAQEEVVVVMSLGARVVVVVMNLTALVSLGVVQEVVVVVVVIFLTA